MIKIAIALLASLSTVLAQCLSNSTFICDGCSKNFTIEEHCVGLCPHGYIEINFTCLENDTAPFQLFLTDFSSRVTFNSSEIDVFKTSFQTFDTPGNPSPTLDRGFYFNKNEFLESNQSFVPAPSMTIDLWVYAIDEGIIISIPEYFELNGKLSYSLSYDYCKILNNCSFENNVAIFNEEVETVSMWRYLHLEISMDSISIISFSFCIDYSETSLTTKIGENAIGINQTSYFWQTGNSFSGFSGFIYKFRVCNSIYKILLTFINPPACLPNHYFDNNACHLCPSCNSTLTCVRDSCELGYSTSCTSYIGYQFIDCFENLCKINCIDCSQSDCDKCLAGTFLITEDNTPACSNNWNLPFNFPSIRNIFISGSKEATDYQNDPEIDDPIPSACRGFYFDGQNKFLVLKNSQIYPNNLIVSVWAKARSGILISKGTKLSVNSNMQMKIVLTDIRDNANQTIISKGITQDSKWHLALFSVEYKNFISTIKEEIDGYSYSLSSSLKMVFLDTIGSTFIGKDDVDFFDGFLAEIKISVYSSTENYGISNTFYCGNILNPCDPNINTNILNSCSLSCSNCDYCYDFATDSCYQCPYGLFTSGLVCDNSCEQGHYMKNGVCYPDKGECFDKLNGFICTSCNSQYYLYKTLCIKSCPYGYDCPSNACDIENPLPIQKYVFENIFDMGTYGIFIIGKESINSYPEIDGNDPIPAKNRGFYFLSSSCIYSSNIPLGPDFSIAFWTKLQTEGEVFSKIDSKNNKKMSVKMKSTSVVWDITTDFGIHKLDIPITGSLLDWNLIQLKGYWIIQKIYYYSNFMVTQNLKIQGFMD